MYQRFGCFLECSVQLACASPFTEWIIMLSERRPAWLKPKTCTLLLHMLHFEEVTLLHINCGLLQDDEEVSFSSEVGRDTKWSFSPGKCGLPDHRRRTQFAGPTHQKDTRQTRDSNPIYGSRNALNFKGGIQLWGVQSKCWSRHLLVSPRAWIMQKPVLLRDGLFCLTLLNVTGSCWWVNGKRKEVYTSFIFVKRYVSLSRTNI